MASQLQERSMNDTQRRAVLVGIPILLLIVGLVAGWIAHALVSPPGQAATVATYGGWTLSCPPYGRDKAECTLALPVLDKQSGGTAASLMMGRASDGLKLAVTVPLSVFLTPGVALALGSDPMRAYHYDTCTIQGCLVAIPVDDKLLASLRSAKQATLEFALPSKDNKPYAVTFPLDGFVDGDDAFLRDEAMRHSWWRRLWS
jgi:invasion protein IalB